MPTPGQLIEVVSDTLGVPAATVFQHDRALVEAGYRRATVRGRSASVTTHDAANLVIAIVGAPPFGPTVKESADTLKKYGRLPAQAAGPYLEAGAWARTMPALKTGHTFASALAEILECLSSGRFESAIGIWPELKLVMTPELVSQQASQPLPDGTTILPVGVWDPGTVDIDVEVRWPRANAEIKITGRISHPFPNKEEEALRYFSIPRSTKFLKQPELLQSRSFSETALIPISSLFKS